MIKQHQSRQSFNPNTLMLFLTEKVENKLQYFFGRKSSYHQEQGLTLRLSKSMQVRNNFEDNIFMEGRRTQIKAPKR